MNPQERDVINGIFDRLKQAEGQPRDPEADTLIAQRLASQPGAAYLLAQIVHVQEQALTNLNDRVNALETEVEQAKAAPAPSGGFLSSLFGASTPPAAQQARPGAAQGARPAGRPGPGAAQGAAAGPWGGRPDQAGFNQGGPNQAGPWGNRGGGGGGFLASAMTTAAGVAGGLVLGNVLANAFGLNDSSSAPAADQTAAADNAAAQDEGAQEAAADDATYQEASYDEGVDDFGGDDFGGGDDWA